MAEEGASPRSRRDSVRDRSMIPEFDRPQGRDRKSLAGMSESVKAILAPLLGGKKSHSKVEVDLGRESGSSAYETVPTGSTPMQRYSTVEASATAPPSEPPPPSSSSTDAHFVETPGTDTITTPTRKTANVLFGPGPQKSKGKYQETVEESSTPARTGSPVDPAYALVDNFLPATKPKMKEYDEYITQTAPQLRARVDSILADTSHEAAAEGLPKLEDTGGHDKPSLLDRVKDTVTGQVPGHSIYSEKATIDDNPVQDVSMGSNVQSGTGSGRFDRDTASEGGTEGVPGPNPNEDHLHGNMDAVDRLRDTVAAKIAKEKTSSLEGDEAPIVRESEEGLPLHPRSSMSSATSPQGAAIRSRTLPRRSN